MTATEHLPEFPWIGLAPLTLPGTEGAVTVDINEYFVRHPEQMLGETKAIRGMHQKDEFAVTGELTPEKLEQALTSLPGFLYQPLEANLYTDTYQKPSYEASGLKLNGFGIKEGVLVRRTGATAEPVHYSPQREALLRAMLGLREALHQVFKTQLDNEPEAQVTAARLELNRVYDAFFAKYGPVNKKDNQRAMEGDPDLPRLRALEKLDIHTGTLHKATIFSQPTIRSFERIEKAGNAAEALAICLNDYAELNWARMQELTGLDQETLLEDLGTLVYRNPDGGAWETADLYLSGNVRRKLEQAREAAALDPHYERNVQALEDVQPEDLQSHEITATLGSPWMPTDVIQAWIGDLLGCNADNVRVIHLEPLAVWDVRPNDFIKSMVSNTQTYGTQRYYATELIEKALNSKIAIVYDEQPDGTRVKNDNDTLAAQERQAELVERFKAWVWEDSARAERLVKIYNQRYNNLRLRTFDGSYLTFPGMDRSVFAGNAWGGDLAPHQKNAIARILQTGVALLNHAVGAGKTFVMVTAAMEMRRLGLARKPLIVVPNHLVDQIAGDFLKLYPYANLFVAGEKTFSKENRAHAMSEIAMGDFDAVIVAYKAFEFLPMDDAYFRRFVHKQIADLEALSSQVEEDEDKKIVERETRKAVESLKKRLAKQSEKTGKKKKTVKEGEKAKVRLTNHIEDLANRDKKDSTILFEELGVDALFVDEFHAFKNLFRISKITRVAGLPNNDSYRAFDMFMKIRWMMERNRNRNVVVATATAIANTVAEMYTMTRYLVMALMIERGIDHFDSWVANFAVAVTSLELSPEGNGFRMNTRMAQFVNLPELLRLYWTFADVQTAETLQLPRPDLVGGKPQVITAPCSPPLKAYVQELVERAEKCRLRQVDPRIDNMLKITGDGRKAALDPRMFDPTIGRLPDCKLSKVADKIYEIYHAYNDDKATQMFFCDLSTPLDKKHRFNAYDEIKELLVAKGIPEEEIVFIQQVAKKDKQKLFDAVNAGKIRILGGSTEMMGTGTNAQDRLKALHNIDCPWRPCDLEQRLGRIQRQGNRHQEVYVFNYVTEGSFDAYMYQTVETKSRFIWQIMKGDLTVRTMEDLESPALTYAEIKALATGNESIREKCQVEMELKKLERLRMIHQDSLSGARQAIRNHEYSIERRRQDLEAYQKDLAHRDTHTLLDDNQEPVFQLQVGEKVFTGNGERQKGMDTLHGAIISWSDNDTWRHYGSFRGFEIWAQGVSSSRLLLKEEDKLPKMVLKGPGATEYEVSFSPKGSDGTLMSMRYVVAKIEDHIWARQQQIAESEEKIGQYRRELDKPFEHEEKLLTLRKRLQELLNQLDLTKQDKQLATVDQTQPTGKEEDSVSEQETEEYEDEVIEVAA